MEEFVEILFIGLHHLGKTAWAFFTEIQTKHATHTLRTEHHAGFFSRRNQSIHQFFRLYGKFGMKVWRLYQFQGRQTCRHRNRVTGKRTRLIHRTYRRQALHNILAAAKSAYRQAPADHFTQRCQVRLDIVQSLRTAQVHTETCHHLIEYQHGAMLGA